MAALPARCSSVVPERVKKLTTEAGAASNKASLYQSIWRIRVRIMAA